MFKRILIIIVVLIGIAFLIPSNLYTDKFTAPTKKSIKKTFSYFDDKVGLPDIDLPTETTTVHKWQDKDGVWHFSNTEPPKGIESKSKTYKDDVNIVPATKIKTEE
jgi:hypothetical protein